MPKQKVQVFVIGEDKGVKMKCSTPHVEMIKGRPPTKTGPIKEPS